MVELADEEVVDCELEDDEPDEPDESFDALEGVLAVFLLPAAARESVR